MNIIDLISDPRIQRNIAPQKLLLLTQLSSQANIKSKEDLIPFFLNASSKAKSMGISSNLTAGEQAKFETIKMLAKMLTERNPGNSMGPNESNI